MRVKNLHSWSGATFNYAPGDEVELPDETAHARVREGRAAYLNEEDRRSAPKNPPPKPEHPKVIAQRAAEKARDDAAAARARKGAPVASASSAEVDGLKKQIASMQAQLAKLTEPKGGPAAGAQA